MKKRRLPENGSRIRTDFEKPKEIYYENVGVPTCLGYCNMQYSLTERSKITNTLDFVLKINESAILCQLH